MQTDDLKPSVARSHRPLQLIVVIVLVAFGLVTYLAMAQVSGPPNTFRTGGLAVDNNVLIGGAGVGSASKFQWGAAAPSASQAGWIQPQFSTMTTQVWIQEDDTGHTGSGGNNEAINIVGRQQTGFALGVGGTATASVLDLAAEPSISSGTGDLSVKTIVVSAKGCAGAGSCEAIEATHGSIRVVDGGNSFGAMTVSGIVDTSTFAVTGGGLVSLGSNVGSFEVNTGIGGAAIVGIGNFNTGKPLSIKNTTTGLSGIDISADTSLNANESGAITFYRGAGNGSEKGGIALVGNAGSFAAGSLVNDTVLYNYDAASAGQRVCIATGSGPTCRMTVATNGDVDFTTHQLHSIVNPTSAQDAATKSYVDNLGTSISSSHTYVSDEFFNAGDNTFTPLWSTGGTGIDSTATATANHPGIRELCTTVTRKSIQAGAGNFDSWLPGGGITNQEWDLRLPVLSNGTDTYIAYFGTTTTVAGSPSRGIYCKADNAVSSNWQGCTTQASTDTCADVVPPVPLVANDWVHCAWQANAAGSSVVFTITDVTNSNVGTVTSATNIPTGVSSPAAYIVKSAGVTSRCIDMDYYWMSQTFTVAR